MPRSTAGFGTGRPARRSPGEGGSARRSKAIRIWLRRRNIPDCPEDDDVDLVAVSYVFDHCPKDDLVGLEQSGRERGLLYVYDPPRLAARLGIAQDVFASDPRARVDADGTVVLAGQVHDFASHFASDHLASRPSSTASNRRFPPMSHGRSGSPNSPPRAVRTRLLRLASTPAQRWMPATQLSPDQSEQPLKWITRVGALCPGSGALSAFGSGRVSGITGRLDGRAECRDGRDG
ncbi:hypothetical protein GCM10010381_69050 [Streptomyces xantholiticus]|nr:hypothetical protein GCM10010381_69050 [Streptomyces xantholiticus]